MTPSGIEPATFRLVAQHLNHCATAVPPFNKYINVNISMETRSVHPAVCDLVSIIKRGFFFGCHEIWYGNSVQKFNEKA